MWLQCLQTRGLISFTLTSHFVQGEPREPEECSPGPQAGWKPERRNMLPSSQLIHQLWGDYPENWRGGRVLTMISSPLSVREKRVDFKH